MEEFLNQFLKAHQELIKQGKSLNEIIYRSGELLGNYFEKLYKGKTVEIKVLRAEPPFCAIRYHMDVFLKRKKVIGQIESVIFTGAYHNFIEIEFSDKPGNITKNKIETGISNLKSIKIIG